MPDRRTLRDIRSAYKGMREYQLHAGEWCHWFRFNKTGTTMHPIYDTGPQRAWFAPITVPLLIGEYERAPQNLTSDDGLYQVDKLHCIISYDQFFHSTMPDPDPTGADHVNDRVAYDGSLFSVDSFLPRGRIASHFLTISVDATEVAQEELDEDSPVNMFAPYISAS